ncbi:hypothetical protein MRB53_042109 [Persea americana]|nr:hypothetical protein MRB53_042109 [Persea americana]
MLCTHLVVFVFRHVTVLVHAQISLLLDFAPLRARSQFLECPSQKPIISISLHFDVPALVSEPAIPGPGFFGQASTSMDQRRVKFKDERVNIIILIIIVTIDLITHFHSARSCA